MGQEGKEGVDGIGWEEVLIDSEDGKGVVGWILSDADWITKLLLEVGGIGDGRNVGGSLESNLWRWWRLRTRL